MLFSQSPVISARRAMTVHVCGAASVQAVQEVFSDGEKKRRSSCSLLFQSVSGLVLDDATSQSRRTVRGTVNGQNCRMLHSQ